MRVLDFVKNNFLYNNKYKTHSEAVIIACYYNPTHNPYRLKAFNEFYNSIKHLNHRIVECVIGDVKPELPQTEFITRVSTNTTLWHKESLLNGIIAKLPAELKYVFWIDADVIFKNQNWMQDAVTQLQKNRVVQLFEYCVHLEQALLSPDFNLNNAKLTCGTINRHPKVWRSFGANHVDGTSGLDNYDKHGHVGFAWGARREVLAAMPLYDKALIGGADHIMAHAAAGQIGHWCITKSFTDDIDAVNEWSRKFYAVVGGKVGFVKGDLYHIWHGDVAKRQYLKRIQDFTSTAKEITERDENGLFVTKNDGYVKEYMEHREFTGNTVNHPVIDLDYQFLYPETQKKDNIVPDTKSRMALREAEFKRREKLDNELKDKARRDLRRQYPTQDDSFIDSLLIGYITDSSIAGTLVGGNVLGAALGDMLNNNDQGFDGGFGGGGFSGGGAGGDFTIPDDNNNNDDNTSNDNFS
jgi:hypothetical protein